MGDFNANINSESVFGSKLNEFCDLHNLCFIDKSSFLPDSYTFISQAHHTTSWLDHCISTVSGQSIISNVYIVNSILRTLIVLMNVLLVVYNVLKVNVFLLNQHSQNLRLYLEGIII